MFRLVKMLTLAVAVLLPFLVAGCSARSATPSATPLSAAAIQSTASDKLQALNSFHFVLEQVGGGTPITMGIEMKGAQGDVVKPDKLQMTITGTAMGFSLTVQLVEVGKTIMMTNPLNGNWENLSDQFQILSVFDPNSGVAAILKGMANAARLADETNAGVNCYHLKGTVDSESLTALAGSAASGVAINAEIWIGQADFLVRTIKLTGKITPTEVDGIVRTLTLSNFNSPVAITLPQ
jgi:lipoprotein LprG